MRYIARVNSGQQLFAGPFIERRAELRDDPEWLAAARADPDTRYVFASGAAQLVRVPSTDIALLRNGDPLVSLAEESSFTLLGWFRGARTVLIEHAEAAPAAGLPEDTELRELRPLAPLLQADAASLLAYARALVLWRSRHRYCGICGAPNVRARAGHVMRCSRESCANETFPRLDPAIIVLVADASGERALLGRQASWPSGPPTPPPTSSAASAAPASTPGARTSPPASGGAAGDGRTRSSWPGARSAPPLRRDTPVDQRHCSAVHGNRGASPRSARRFRR